MTKLFRWLRPLVLAGAVLGGCSKRDGSDLENLAQEDTKQLQPAWWKKRGGDDLGVDCSEENLDYDSSGSKNSIVSKSRATSRKPRDYVEDFAGLNMKMIGIPAGVIYYPLGEMFVKEEVCAVWMQECEMSIEQYFKLLEVSRYDPARNNEYRPYIGVGGIPKDISNPLNPITELSINNARFIADFLKVRTLRGYRLPTLGEVVAANTNYKHTSNEPFGPVNASVSHMGGDLWKTKAINVRSLKPNAQGFYHLFGNAEEFLYLVGDGANLVADSNFDLYGPENPGVLSAHGGYTLEPSDQKYFKIFKYDKLAIGVARPGRLLGIRLVRDPKLDLERK